MKLDDATADRLRELGATEDMLTWLREPEAVRTLVRLRPVTGEEYSCPTCDADDGTSHFPGCPVAKAWRDLGDPRAAEDVERAHGEALWMYPAAMRQRSREYAPRRPYFYRVDPNVKNGYVYSFVSQVPTGAGESEVLSDAFSLERGFTYSGAPYPERK